MFLVTFAKARRFCALLRLEFRHVCMLQVMNGCTTLDDVTRLYLQLCAGSHEPPLDSTAFAGHQPVTASSQKGAVGGPLSLLALAGYAQLGLTWTPDAWPGQLEACAGIHRRNWLCTHTALYGMHIFASTGSLLQETVGTVVHNWNSCHQI